MRYLVIENGRVINVVEGDKPAGYVNLGHIFVERSGSAADAWIGWTMSPEGVFSLPPPPPLPPEEPTE